MIQQANDELKLKELLIDWEEARDRGEPVSVTQLCRDCPEVEEELRRRVQALIDWDQATPGSSLRSSSVSEAAIKALDCSPASACVTLEFRKLDLHDRGGLGVIFKARQDDLPRDVALKFIRPDRVGTAQNSKRFLREAQITARLEHPGIVPIYGVGEDETGNDCYAMRFVEGTTLEQAIEQFHTHRDQDRERVSLAKDRAFRSLLQRFRSACTTVGYAHSRGVLHRDIKPANIMLGPFDETLVLDWGLGKILASGDAQVEPEVEPAALMPSRNSDETGISTVMGTLGFMSPEQQTGRWEEVCQASDIYGLGVTLYVLLTGKLPFEGCGPSEIAAKVERGEFPPPRQVKPEIPRPLEAICLKAMALASEDRYGSAIELAGDLENWLADEPVQALSDPLQVRVRRWTSRHRTLVTSGAVGTVLVLFSLIAIVVLQNGSNSRLSARNEELRQARVRAEARVNLALDAIDQFRGAVAKNPQLKFRPEFAELRKLLLRTPQEIYEEIKQDIEESHDTSPEAWAGLAKVVLGLARITGEVDSRPDAIRAYKEGIRVLDRLLSSRPDDSELEALQAGALLQLAKFQSEEGKRVEAVHNNERAREILQVQLRQRPGDVNLRLDLGRAYDQLGLVCVHEARAEAARANFEKASEILEESESTRHHLMLPLVYNHLGLTWRKMRSFDKALGFYQESIELLKRLRDEQPSDPWIQYTLALVHFNIGNIRVETGRGDAFKSFEQANAIYEPLVREYHSFTDFRVNYARSLGNFAIATSGSRTKLQAISVYTRVAELMRGAVELNPGVVRYQLDLAKTLLHLTRSHLFVDQPLEAMKHALEGTERLEALVAANTDPSGQANNLLGMIWEKRADALIALGHENDAVEAFRIAIRHQGKAIEEDPSAENFREELFNHRYRLAGLRLILGQTHEATAEIAAMQSLWPAKSYELLGSARELARRWSRANATERGRAKLTESATELYGALVVTLLEKSVNAGLREVVREFNDPTFEAFRSRDDFQRLLIHSMDLDFPANPFIQGEINGTLGK